jgi:DNA-binding NarL/FixJ family response regulator
MDLPPDAISVRIAVTSAECQLRARLEAAIETLGHEVCATGSGVDDLPAGPPAPDVVVMMLGGSPAASVKALAEVRERLPKARVLLVVPAGRNRERRIAALGADGIVYETDLDRMFGPALAAFEAGLAVLPRELNSTRLNPTLSSREKQVLAMVVMGFTNIEIATKLYLAESTVKSHLSSSFRKLGVSSRKDAAARILDPDSGLGPGILAISGNGIAMLSGRAPESNGSAAA